ncbi:hypothetical protein Zmor_013993 [Zophobas morio]|uniref:Osteopetrosis-associated transmembrane protein 1 n=1 Tax=Zophobas morio TaxID=2755281 RepID=A0AA38IET2_9CUCU|nr:hypothetical protein Zmor_013993 [Zophobas morio]
MWAPSLIFFFLVHIVTSANMETNCSVLKEMFANSTSNFIACSINSSQPITICQDCVQLYLSVSESYKNMTQLTDSNHTHCIDYFINLDRLQIVENLYSNTYNLWSDAKCDECFQFVNGTLTPNKSDEARTFQTYYSDFMHCVDTHDNNDTILCPKCIKDYIKMNDYFSSFSNENEKIGTCMDIVDLMNKTRSFWSDKCCKYRRHNEYVFMASTVTVLIVTLCFYVIAQFCSVKKAPTILQQRRFAESFNQTSYSDDQ